MLLSSRSISGRTPLLAQTRELVALGSTADVVTDSLRLSQAGITESDLPWIAEDVGDATAALSVLRAAL